MLSRAQHNSVALETTLLLHGVPRDSAHTLARQLHEIIASNGAHPCPVGVLAGEAIVGMDFNELAELLEASDVPKANSSNLGILIHRQSHAATSVSATMELASRAGVRIFATGGIGGVHRNFSERFDVSSDLAAIARFPLAVVASGVKSILDVPATREALETLGVPVVGFRTHDFPAFYTRRWSPDANESDAAGSRAALRPRVDARFDDIHDLARFIHAELARSGRGILVCNPIPESDEAPDDRFRAWLHEAERRIDATEAQGRDSTPALLAALHEISHGATLRANLALVRSNALLAAQIASAMPHH
jgi:pseudouridine-5'-phosphate glycosidase